VLCAWEYIVAQCRIAAVLASTLFGVARRLSYAMNMMLRAEPISASKMCDIRPYIAVAVAV
jgi:hypothetical protein